MATALTLWAVAAIYTSSMTVEPVSLDTEEHFQPTKPSRYGGARRRGGGDDDDDNGDTSGKAEMDTPSGEESTSFERRFGRRDELRSDEDETETETETRRRFKREYDLPRIKTEEFDERIYDWRADDDVQEEMRLRSLESLEAKDAADLAEAIRQSRMRDVLEARRMGGSTGVGTSAGTVMVGKG